MLYPSIDKLLKNVNPNRFKIIIAVASRARDIDDKEVRPLVTDENDKKKKSISIALIELSTGKITIKE